MQSFFSRVAEAQELDHITHPVEGQCFSQVTWQPSLQNLSAVI